MYVDYLCLPLIFYLFFASPIGVSWVAGEMARPMYLHIFVVCILELEYYK
jgi:hypothetical protein